jgi:hypothetical protein
VPVHRPSLAQAIPPPWPVQKPNVTPVGGGGGASNWATRFLGLPCSENAQTISPFVEAVWVARPPTAMARY